MKFNLQFLLSVPPPWDKGSEYRAVWEAVAETKLAERHGFDMVSAVEHHFLEEYSHCSAPEVFLAALAQYTQRMKVGHMVRLLPHKYNHPIRSAEMAAMLDLLSNGRLVFGIGRSSTLAELDGFGIDPEDARNEMVEAMEVIFKAWGEGPMEHDGPKLTIPKRNVLPKPLQDPHPQIWMAGGSPASLDPAGRAGYGAACLAFDVEVLKEVQKSYLAAAAEPDNIPDGAIVFPKSKNPVTEFVIPIFPFCSESKDDLEAGLAGIRWEMQAVFNQVGGVRVKKTYEYLADAMDSGHQPKDATDEELLMIPQVVAGTPEMCLEKIRFLNEAGFDGVNLTVAPACGHAENMETLRLFGEHILPEFQPYPDPDAAEPVTA